MKNVLILCTGNSCRSVMAEGLLRHLGRGRFQANSAGSRPTGQIHPHSLATLRRHGMDDSGFASKSWETFRQVPLDIVITVCDSAAGETCPVFPGAPVKAHWGVPDPAHFEGTQAEIAAEFDRVFGILEKRVRALVDLPVESMNREQLQERLEAIGHIE